jgi:hypothetical protein
MHALPSMEISVSRFYGVFHLTGERTVCMSGVRPLLACSRHVGGNAELGLSMLACRYLIDGCDLRCFWYSD